MVFGDVVDESFDILPLEDINEKYNLNMNFLEQLYTCIQFLEKPLSQDVLPRNSSINFLLNLDQKGVSYFSPARNM